MTDSALPTGVSFNVERGEIFAILGRNGAGKTTVESIAGLRRPDEGRISVLGLDPARDVSDLRRKVGIQLQESQMPDRIEVHPLSIHQRGHRQDPLAPHLRQLGVNDRAAAVGAAFERGLLTPGAESR